MVKLRLHQFLQKKGITSVGLHRISTEAIEQHAVDGIIRRNLMSFTQKRSTNKRDLIPSVVVVLYRFARKLFALRPLMVFRYVNATCSECRATLQPADVSVLAKIADHFPLRYNTGQSLVQTIMLAGTKSSNPSKRLTSVFGEET